jgi:adenosyl cobinamide kinase/adenosyl cobinamide phosphate guanylyltransferase
MKDIEKSPKCVYVLQLEDNKWYIGETNDLEHRIEMHKKGGGSAWTKLHEVIDVKEIIPKGNEKIITLKYMKEFGYNNVRGYAWSQSKDFSLELIRNFL